MHAVLKNILFLLQEWLETHEEIIGFPSGLAVENLPARAQDIKDTGSIPGSGRSPGVGNSNLLQYPCLEKSHGQRSLVGYSPWSHKEPDMTEMT